MVGAGGAAYYFKIVKGKRGEPDEDLSDAEDDEDENDEPEDEDIDDEYGDEPEEWDERD